MPKQPQEPGSIPRAMALRSTVRKTAKSPVAAIDASCVKYPKNKYVPTNSSNQGQKVAIVETQSAGTM